MKNVLKLICLSTLMLGGALHAMQSDAIELGKQLVDAAYQQDWPKVEELIVAGADLNQKDDWQGKTALGWAAHHNNSEIVRQLIAAGADLNQQNVHGETVLIDVIVYNYTEIAQMLIEAQVDLNQKTNDGWTALMFAARTNRTEVVQMLIDAGVDLYQEDDAGKTALIIAAAHNHPKIAQMLIDAMLAHPIDPSKAPKALTDEQKNLLHVAGMSLLKTTTKDTRRLILERLATIYRQQNFVRDQINSIENQEMKAKLLAYFESKIKNEKEEK